MRRLAAIAGLLAVAGCGAEPRSGAAPGLTIYSDERAGFEVAFPSDWHRARTRLTAALTDPVEILSVGTVRPWVNGGDTWCAKLPVATLRRMRPRDVFLSVQERIGGLPEAAARPRGFALDHAEASDAEDCLRRPVPFRSHWLPFRDRGRGFYAIAAVGHEAPPERERQLLAVLDSRRTGR